MAQVSFNQVPPRVGIRKNQNPTRVGESITLTKKTKIQVHPWKSMLGFDGNFGKLFRAYVPMYVSFSAGGGGIIVHYGNQKPHRENGGENPWDGGPSIINPLYTLYHVGIDMRYIPF